MNNDLPPEHPANHNRVLILNGFSNGEIVIIMRSVKALCRPGADNSPPALAVAPGDIIFAKATPQSLHTPLKDLIANMSADHAYLKANPPKLA